MIRLNLRCRDGATVGVAGGWACLTVGAVAHWRMPCGHALADLLARLSGSGVAEEDLETAALASEDAADLASLYALLESGRAGNLFWYDLCVNGEPWLTIEPLAATFRLKEDAPPGWIVSRFACLRRGEHGRMWLECPASPPARVHVYPTAAAEVAALMAGNEENTEVSPHRDALRHCLARAGFLDPPQADNSPARRQWEFHDWFFHRASRAGSSPRCGATYRFRGELEQAPPVKAPMGSDSLALPQPAATLAPPGSFLEVLERRRSLRGAGASPLSVSELAHFLYRLLHPAEPDPAPLRRVYPAGGGLHELEFYVAAHRCAGLPAGLYHYRAADHRLDRLAAAASCLDRLLAGARQAWGAPHGLPDVLVIVAARVPRLAWKYESMAYRAVLLNAGVALQTMYLIATELHLAPCALGNGDPELFAAATGLDPFEETSVAEFALSAAAGP